MKCTTTQLRAMLARAVFLTLVFMTLGCADGFAQLIANFTAAPVNGCGPLTVNFTDLSLGPVTAWAWDIDNDGVFDYNSQNPSHTYAAPGTYSVTLRVSTAFGFITSTRTINNLVRVFAQPTVNAGGARNICTGGSVVIGGAPTASGGAGPYAYAWSPSAGLSATNVPNPVASPAGTTTYTVTVIDANGCTATGATTVSVQPLPGVNAGSDVTSCNGIGAQIGGSPTAAGGTGPYTYSWSPGTGLSSTTVSNPIANPGATTSYTVTVTDAFGCTGTDAVTVAVSNRSTASAGPDRAICLGGGTVIGGTPTAGGGSGSYTYVWSPSTGLSSVNAANPFASPNTSTSYTVTVTDGNGCTASDMVQVLVTPAPNASAGPNRTICLGGSVVIGGAPTGTGGSPPYTYAWGPGAGLSATNVSNPTASPTTTTTYTVTVTDANGCAASSNVTVSVSPQLIANAGVDQTLCRGNATILGGFPTASGGTAPYTYAWAPSTGLNSSTIPNPTARPVVSTVYTVTVTDVNGCTGTDVVNVIVVPNPAANAGPDVTICRGASVVLGSSPTATGGLSPYAYAWTPSTGLSATNVPNPTASPLSTTIYDVTVTDANGCTSTDAVTVTVSPVLRADAGPDAQLCRGASLVLGGVPSVVGGTPPFTYAWSPSTGLNSTTIPNPTASPLSTTIYTLMVTDAAGCSATDAISLIVNPAPGVDPGPAVQLCRGDSATLGGSPTGFNGTPPYTYLWSPASGLSSATVANPVARPAATTTYAVTLTDANGCAATSRVLVTVFANPNADAGPDVAVCSGSGGTALGGSPTARGGAGPYSFAWSPAAGLSAVNVANPIADPGAATTYTVIVTDANGCSDTDQVDVAVNPSPTADAGADVSVCRGLSATIGGAPTGSGGAGPYTYLWSPARGLNSRTAANPVASPASTTTYRVVVTDALGCSDSARVTVTVTPKPIVDAGGSVAICFGTTTRLGGAPTASSGTPPYRFAWSPAVSLSAANVANPTASPTATTQYTVVVTDANGCIDSNNVVVTVLSPQADAGRDTVICLGSSTRLGGSPTATGGTAPYRYVWFPSIGLNAATVSNPVARPATTTAYTVTVTDANGCVVVSSPVTVTVNEPPQPGIAVGGPTTFCSGDSLALDANRPYRSYQWLRDGLALKGDTNRTMMARLGGIYRVSVVDTNGCEGISPGVRVTVNKKPTPSISGPRSVCGGADRMTYRVENTPGNEYAWNVSPNGEIVSGQGSNRIVVKWGATGRSFVSVRETVTATGCFADTTYDVTVHENPEPIIVPSDTAICDGTAIELDGGADYVDYRWYHNGIEIAGARGRRTIAIADGGAYRVRVVDINGCSGTSPDITIGVNPRPVPVIAGSRNACENTVAQYRIVSTAGNSYLWSVGLGGVIVGPDDENTVSVRWGAAGRGLLNVTETVGGTGCSADTTMEVDITAAPTPRLRPLSKNICEGDSAALDLGVRYADVRWYRDGRELRAERGRSVMMVGDSGRYHALVTDGNGCVGSSDTAEIAISPKPAPVVAGPAVVCEDLDTATYSVTDVPGDSYAWEASAGAVLVTRADAPSVSVLWNQAGRGTVKVTQTRGPCVAENELVVDVIARPAPRIAGADTVCQDAGEQYTTANVPGNRYQWIATGGVITGPADRSTVNVLWGAAGTASLQLTETAGATGCSTTVAIGVLINARPAKPEITSTLDPDGNELLRASDAPRYQWYRDGEMIAGATSQIHVPASLGRYTVVISDTNLCPTESDPFTVDASATVTFPSITESEPGKRVLIPVQLLSSRNLRISGATRFQTNIRFNRNMLHPVDEVCNPVLPPNVCNVFIRDGRRPAEMTEGTLRTTEFETMLGDSECTSVMVHDFVWQDQFGQAIDSGIQTTVIPGRFCTNVCTAGGKRLFTASGRLTLKQNRPNPFNPTTEIEYEVTEPGRTVLSVHDMLGRRVAMLVDADVAPGSYSVTFDAGDLSSGMYVYTLRTPTRAVSRVLHVEK